MALCIKTLRALLPTNFRTIIAFSVALLVGLLASAAAQTFTIIHTFTGPEGANPAAGLTMDNAGNLYGTTEFGGGYSCVEGGCGSVFKLSNHGGSWVLSKLYAFQGSSDGAGPQAKVVFGRDGALYGTTSDSGQGTAFRLQPPTSFCHSVSCPWTKTTLFTFNFYDEATGFVPTGDLTFDADGNIYGTTFYGGDTQYCNLGCGLVYQLARSGGDWTENVLYNFTGTTDGATPRSGVDFDQSGNLIGTAFNDGNRANAGTVFELTPSNGGWLESTVYGFHDSGDGGYPDGGLILDASGNVYGTTSSGGSGGGGTVFELVSSGGDWNFNLLYSLSGAPNYFGPFGKLVKDAAGNLYGTTLNGGPNHWGTVFKLTPSNGGWLFTDLHDFTNGYGGSYPEDGLVVDSNGNIYGTAQAGGIAGNGCGIGLACGLVWEITP